MKQILGYVGVGVFKTFALGKWWFFKILFIRKAKIIFGYMLY